MVLTDNRHPAAAAAKYRSLGSRRAAKGFSLIELVIVVVIIGIIAAIAIPRMSRGSAGATDAALSGNLSVLRNAIDLYHTEHQAYPTLANFEAQLTEYTNNAGDNRAAPTAAERAAGYVYGPYLRKMPTIPVGPNKGEDGLAVIPGTLSTAPGAGIGWYYNETTGEIKAASGSSEDVNGNPHHDY